MNQITITIPGEPIAWARAGRSGRRSYTPKKNKAYETAIAKQTISVMQDREPFLGPVDVRVTAYFAIPASWPRWKQKAAHDGSLRHTGVPDLDNIEKAALDGLNRSGKIWIDDSYVCAISAAKEYSLEPRLEIIVFPAPGAPSQVTTQKQMRAAL